MQKMYYENYEETEQDRLDEQRYAQKRNMSVEEKKEVVARITRESIENARKMVAASGEEMLTCPAVIQACMAALVYGMLSAMVMEELGAIELWWTRGMLAGIANVVFEMGPEQSIQLTEYIFENSSKAINPDLNRNIHLLVHYGIDLYFLLDQPKRLFEIMHGIIHSCYEDFVTAKES